jgi:hypothetical protein
MKSKSEKQKRPSLKRETLRQLTTEQLQTVAGGEPMHGFGGISGPQPGGIYRF